MSEKNEPNKKGFVRSYTGIPFYYRWIFYAILLGIVIYYKPTGAGLSDISKLDKSNPTNNTRDKIKPAPIAQKSAYLRLLLVFDDASRIFAEILELPVKVKYIKGKPEEQLKQLNALIAADEKKVESKRVLSRTAALATGKYSAKILKVLNLRKLSPILISTDNLNTYSQSLQLTTNLLGGVMGRSLLTGYPAAKRMKYTAILLPHITQKMKSVKDIREILIVREIEKKGDKTIFTLETPSVELALVLNRLKLKAVPGKNGKISLKEITDRQIKYFVLLRSFNFIKPTLPGSLSEVVRCTLSDEKVKAPGVYLGEVLESLAGPFRSEQCNREFFQAMLLRFNKK